jgi:hypothetical protein
MAQVAGSSGVLLERSGPGDGARDAGSSSPSISGFDVEMLTRIRYCYFGGVVGPCYPSDLGAGRFSQQEDPSEDEEESEDAKEDAGYGHGMLLGWS